MNEHKKRKRKAASKRAARKALVESEHAAREALVESERRLAESEAAREALVASEHAAREALDASEQRLAASDAAREALVASERAAREALDASEQRLVASERAVREALEASEQRLAASEAAREALVASERAAREALDASEQRLAASDAAREALVASERAAREALDASEQLASSLNGELKQFREAFERAPIGMAILDLDGRFTDANRSMCEATGCTPTELRTMAPFAVWHPEDRITAMTDFARLGEETGTLTLEGRVCHGSGHAVTMKFGITVIHDEHGAPSKALAQVLEATRPATNEPDSLSAERDPGTTDDAAEVVVDDELAEHYDHEHEAGLYDEPEDDYDHEREAGLYDRLETVACDEQEPAADSEWAPATGGSESATADYLAEHPDRDELTGLLSQRGFQMVLDAHLARCASSHATGALLLLELDGAEMVNEMLGQETGDALIVRCGQGLRGRLRESDTIARLEGAEFAVLLPDQTSSQAEVVAKALVDVVSEATADIGNSLPARVTIAIGAADFPDQPCSSDEMFARAARAKQVAKDSGRNKYALCRANASGVQRITVTTPAAPASA